MLRYVLSATAALGISISAASADTALPTKVTINQNTGEYCIADAPITGSRVGQQECHSVEAWAKKGVVFSKAPQKLAQK